MTTKENFAKRYNQLKADVIADMDKALERAICNKVLDFDKMVDNFLDVYPLIGAVLQRNLVAFLEGGSYNSTTRALKRQSSKYCADYRIWHDYAGDYRSKGKI